jgi:ribonuclease-3
MNLTRESLSEVAKEIKLGQYVFISKGEWAGGREKDSILSDTLVALIGALFLNLWLEATKQFIVKYIYSHITEISTEPVKSYKTLAQEYIQKLYKHIPEYKDIEHELDDKGNPISYRTELFVQWKKESEWFGVSKKKAQEDAAKNFYTHLHIDK